MSNEFPSDWRHLRSLSEEELTELLCAVAQRIAATNDELAMVRGQERQAKVRTYFECGLDTVSARERAADQAALDLTTEVFKLTHELDAEREKRDLLLHLINR